MAETENPNNVVRLHDRPGGLKLAQFWCKGCKEFHLVLVRTEGVILTFGEVQREQWQEAYQNEYWLLSGGLERPTIGPWSIHGRPRGSTLGCHFFIRNGRMEFQMDSFHMRSNSGEGRKSTMLPVGKWPKTVVDKTAKGKKK
jgi:hypothetical protein